MSTLRQNCMDAVDHSLAAGLLLEQIVYWSKHSRIKKEDGIVTVHTYQEWAKKACLSEPQVQYAIRVLKKKKLISTYNAPHKYRYGILKALHVVLDSKIYEELLPSKVRTVSDKTTDQSVHMYEPSYKKEYKDNIKGDVEIANDTGEDKMNMEEIEKKIKEKQKENNYSLTSSAKENSNDAVGLWRQCFSQNYEGMCEDMTNKRRAHFKSLAKQFGPASLQEMITVCLQNWDSFVNYVMEAKGHFKGPNSPSVDYFYTNRVHAKNFISVLHSSAPTEEEDKNFGVKL